jgi:hypothetical protein
VQPGSAMRPLKRMLPLLAWASALTDIRATHSRMEFRRHVLWFGVS